MLRRISRTSLVGASIGAVLMTASPGVAMACETCFGAAVDSEVTRGIGLAMLLLLIVVTFVFAGILWFFKNTMTRTRMLREGRLMPPGNKSVIPPTALN
ncbi:MAG: hypothetical protein HKN13_14015 [Rhodothermales bacterium]|nr:hypothetical protein [Rhodothermales bacterium]